MTIKNCYSKCITATGNSIKHEEEFLGFTEDVCEASNTLQDRLQVNDLRALVHINNETPIAVYKDYEEIVAEVLNCGRAEYLLQDDSKNEEMCEIKTPKISKALDSISEVMSCMERQSDSDHLHPLHLQNIKTYVAKKHHQLSRQKKILDYFKNTD
jgi:hypothetical protein